MSFFERFFAFSPLENELCVSLKNFLTPLGIHGGELQVVLGKMALKRHCVLGMHTLWNKKYMENLACGAKGLENLRKIKLWAQKASKNYGKLYIGSEKLRKPMENKAFAAKGLENLRKINVWEQKVSKVL